VVFPQVTETDSLPQQMCYQCASTLIAWHDLVISCLEADKKLRELQVEEEVDDDDDKGVEVMTEDVSC
jgi:Zinc-finger associated domain (zf-AD).